MVTLCSGECHNIVHVIKYDWLSQNQTYYFFDMEFCTMTLRQHIQDMGNYANRLRTHKERPSEKTSPLFDPLLHDYALGYLSINSSQAATVEIWSESAMAILHDILVGLIYIHSKRFVHRDLKPSNGTLPAKSQLLKTSALFGRTALLEIGGFRTCGSWKL